MKNITTIVLAAATTVLAASCQVIRTEDPMEFSYSFAAAPEDGATKVALGTGDTIVWNDGDEVGTFAPMTANFPSTVAAGEPPVITARLGHPVNVGEEFCFYYPWYANAGDDALAATIRIAPVQDGGISAMPMCTAPYVTTEDFVSGDEVPLLQFYNAGSVIEFKVWADEGLRSEKLRRIVLDASAPICGTAAINLAEVSGDDRSTACADGYDNDVLTVDLATPASIAASSASADPVYAVVAPGTCSLDVSVYTDAASYSFTIPEKEFVRSGLRTFILHLTADKRKEMSDSYTLITSADELQDGEYVIAAHAGSSYYGFGSSLTLSSGKLSGTALTVNDGTITLENGQAHAVTITGNSTDGWTISNGTYRLAGTSGNTNLKDVSASGSLSKDCLWTISAGKNGTFRFTNSNDSSRGLVFRNQSSPIFGHYALSNVSATSKEYYDLELFKSGGKAGLPEYGHTETTLQTPVLSEGSAKVSDDQITVTWTADPGAASGYRCMVDGFEPVTVFPDSNGKCTLQLDGLTENTTYCISIYAVACEVEDGGSTSVYRQSDIASITLTTKEYIAPSADGWTLVTDAAELEAGDRVIFASKCNASGGYVTTFVNGDIPSGEKYLSEVAATFDEGFTSIDDLPEKAVPFTLGGSEGAWTFTNEDMETLGVTSLKNLAWDEGTRTWTISIGTDGKATVSSTVSSYGFIQYNATSPRFNTYSSTQTAIYIFRNGSDVTGGPTQLVMPEIRCAARGQAFLTFEWDKPAHATQYGVRFDSGAEKMQTGTSAYFSGLQTGSTHTISVRAYGSSDHYLTSEWKTFSCSTLAEGSSQQTGSACRGWFELPAQKDDNHDGIDDDDPDLYYSWTMRADAPKIRNFSCCYSKSMIHPVWVAAPFHSCYTGSSGRNDSYKNDPAIGCAQSSKFTGYTRGHMVGSSDRTVSKETNRQAFYYSNIAAQLSSGFNTGGGAWNNLESFVDGKWCSDTLYMVNGCIFESFTDRYGSTVSAKKGTNGAGSAFQVPTAFYKVMLRTKSGKTGKRVDQCTADELMCVAFILTHRSNAGHKPSAKDMYSVEEVEELTGLNFFVNVPNAPKSTYSPSDWGL